MAPELREQPRLDDGPSQAPAASVALSGTITLGARPQRPKTSPSPAHRHSAVSDLSAAHCRSLEFGGDRTRSFRSRASPAWRATCSPCRRTSTPCCGSRRSSSRSPPAARHRRPSTVYRSSCPRARSSPPSFPGGPAKSPSGTPYDEGRAPPVPGGRGPRALSARFSMTAMLKKQRQFGPLLSEHQHKRVALPQVGGLACRAALGGDLGGRLASRLLGCHRVDFVLVGMRAIAARPYLAPLPRSKLVDPGGKRGPTLRGGGHRAHGSGQRPAVLEVVVHGGAYLLVGERAGTDLACVQVAALLEFPGPVAWEPLFGQPSSLITPAAQCPHLMYSSTALFLFSYEYIDSPDVIR